MTSKIESIADEYGCPQSDIFLGMAEQMIENCVTESLKLKLRRSNEKDPETGEQMMLITETEAVEIVGAYVQFSWWLEAWKTSAAQVEFTDRLLSSCTAEPKG